jgi:hypothetical protein
MRARSSCAGRESQPAAVKQQCCSGNSHVVEAQRSVGVFDQQVAVPGGQSGFIMMRGLSIRGGVGTQELRTKSPRFQNCKSGQRRRRSEQRGDGQAMLGDGKELWGM